MTSKASAIGLGMAGATASSAAGGKAEFLYSLLKADLLAGHLSPGQLVSEASLSKEYGVSRSPIREATIRLQHDGLVERSGQRVRVRDRSFDEIVDIYRVRVFLEGAIAADAADRHTPADLARLQRAVEANSRVDPRDTAAMVASNRAFHRALSDAAHNATLADLQQRLTDQVGARQSTTLSHPGRWEEAIQEHADIVGFVAGRDSAAARSVAEQHMSRARDLWLAGLDQPR